MMNKSLAQQKVALENFFAHYGDHAAMQALKALLLEFLATKEPPVDDSDE